MKALPLVYYPTKIMWVDDDPLFLQIISEAVENTPAQLVNSPQKCLQILKSHEFLLPHIPLFRSYVDHEEYGLNQHFPLDVDLATLFNLRNNSNRLNDITVLIVDYHMPEINGLKLCRELKDLPIKKILLTGEADHKIAVDAFNEGIIDCFIQKDNINLVDDLRRFIGALQCQYFRDITFPLLAHLESEHSLPLTDPVFIDFYNTWCNNNGIKEYYLADKNGSFIAIDRENKLHYLILHTDHTLDDFVDLYNDEKEVTSILNSVKNREKIPFFGLEKESWEVETKAWASHFYSPQILQGKGKYYLSITP